MRSVRRVLRLGLPLLALGAGRAAAQAPGPPRAAPVFSTGVRPDTVTVGDRFVVVLRARLPPGARVELPARLDSTPDLHPAGPPVQRGDPARGDFAAAYPMVAWRPGEPEPLFAPVRVTHADGRVATRRVALRLPSVRSVLPADSARVEPRGPRDVLGPSWDPRLIALVVALVVFALLLLPTGALVRRWLRRRAERTGAQSRDPRERALATLDRARTMRLVESGEWKPFYTLTSEALRGYLDALSPRWSADLTTEELVHALRASRAGGHDARLLAGLLAEADVVKFGNAASTAADAERHWRQARDWVAGFAPPGAPDAAEPVEAAG